MKIRNTMIFILVVLLLTFLAGCNSNPQDLPEQASENNEEEVKLDAEKNAHNQEADLNYGEITDPKKLEELWQEYLYDTIATIGNAHDFNSAAEIDPIYIAEYSWKRYITEHGKESLALADEASGSRNRVFPLETVQKYAQRYFNLTTLDVTKIDERYYDSERRAFIFSFGDERDRPRYNGRNPWGVKLGEVTRNSDGTITAVLEKYVSSAARRVERTQTYILKPHEDGSLYFVSGQEKYINNHLVELTGDFKHFDKIAGFGGNNMQELFMLGEQDNQLILAYAPYDKKKNGSLMLVSPETMKVEKKLDLGENFAATHAAVMGEKIVVRLKDKVRLIDKKLEQSEEVPLPQVIKDKIARASQQDRYFGGYDISKDLTKIVYSDEEGLKLFNLADNSEKMLAETQPVGSELGASNEGDLKLLSLADRTEKPLASTLSVGRDFFSRSYHSSPRFVADGQKVITTMTGYESAMGYTLYDLQKNTLQGFSIAGEASSSGFIRYDTGVLEVKGVRNPDKETYECILQYLDFRTGTVQEIKAGDLGDGGFIRFPELTYVGENDAAFITLRQGNEYTKNMSYLHRLNLETLKLETNIVTVKAAQTNILGVLSDGRVIFWYNLNSIENGIGITQLKDGGVATDDTDRKQEMGQFTGLKLGMSRDEVIEALGDGFTENWSEPDWAYLEYENGITVVLGHNGTPEREVTMIEIASAEFPTDLGVKHGDNLEKALELYREEYKEHISIHNDDKVTGMFEITEDIILRFYYDEEQSSDTKISSITVAYLDAFYL